MSGAAFANLAIAPLLVPFGAGVASLVLRRSPLATRVVGVAAALGQLAVAARLLGLTAGGEVVALEVGGFPAPFGIVVAVDLLGAMMVGATAVVGAVALVHAMAHVDPDRERAGFFAFYHFLVAGVAGAFVTGDLFNLFVWFELLLVASYVLVAIGSTPDQLREGITYMALNMVASAFFLVGVAVVYRVAGTLNMADLALRARALGDGAPLAAVSLVLLLAFGLKAGLFPLFFWLPGPYDASPPTITPVFAALLTNVGAYALLRGFGMIFVGRPPVAGSLLLGLGAITAIAGALGALAERAPRRVLTFTILGQIGLVVTGLGMGSPDGLRASIYLVLHDAVVFPALFLAVALAGRRDGREPDGAGGLVRRRPWAAALLFGATVSMAGAPPWSGFSSKLALLQAAFSAGRAWVAWVALLASFLTLVAMIRLFVTIAWGEEGPETAPAAAAGAAAAWPAATLVALSLALGLAMGPILEAAGRAGGGLLEPEAYVRAVLGAGR